MKHLERITLITTGAATLVAAAILTRRAIRARFERLYRVAAGESSYERTHNRMRRASHA